MKRILIVAMMLNHITVVNAGSKGNGNGSRTSISAQKITTFAPKKIELTARERNDLLENFQEVMDEIDAEYKKYEHAAHKSDQITILEKILEKIKELDYFHSEYPKPSAPKIILHEIERMHSLLANAYAHHALDLQYQAFIESLNALQKKYLLEYPSTKNPRDEMRELHGQFRTATKDLDKGSILNQIILKLQDLDAFYKKYPDTDMRNYIKVQIEVSDKMLKKNRQYITKDKYKQNIEMIKDLAANYAK